MATMPARRSRGSWLESKVETRLSSSLTNLLKRSPVYVRPSLSTKSPSSWWSSGRSNTPAKTEGGLGVR